MFVDLDRPSVFVPEGRGASDITKSFKIVFFLRFVVVPLRQQPATPREMDVVRIICQLLAARRT